MARCSEGTNLLQILISLPMPFLEKHVKNGKVDYKTLKNNFIEIDQLYQSLAGVNVNNLSKDEKMAFYINAYNIIVIRQITDYYPLKSALG